MCRSQHNESITKAHFAVLNTVGSFATHCSRAHSTFSWELITQSSIALTLMELRHKLEYEWAGKLITMSMSYMLEMRICDGVNLMLMII